MLAEKGPAWLEAAMRRCSRRSFDGRAVDAEVLDALEAVCEGFRPYPDARAVLVRDPGEGLFRGVVGAYGKVTDAPHAIAIVADTSGRFAQQHAGYTGEAAVLEATALGLDTCWVAGFFDRTTAGRLVTLGASERVLAVTPVGFALKHTTLAEKTMRASAGAHRRKPLRTIAPDADPGWPAWALAAVEAARIAPSAMNRQPWRFRLADGALVVSRDSAGEVPKVTKALDCGIAMLHAELAALGHDAPGAWTDLDGKRDVARYQPEPRA